jgi:tetratricopeptide (TPR) repeat protein
MSRIATKERTAVKRRWGTQAIRLAMENQWEKAVEVNQSILELFPRDVESHNRLGRSLTELGRYPDALAAYQSSLRLDKSNLIAKRNARRLSDLMAKMDSARPIKPEAVDPRIFISEEGKTGILKIARIVDQMALDEATLGEQVSLCADGRALYANNISGKRIGLIEPQASQRLINLINGGNRYQAAIMSIDPEGEVKIFVRETFRHAFQAGKVSFPPRSGTAAVRGYSRIRETGPEYEENDYETIIGVGRSPGIDFAREDDGFGGGDAEDELVG